MKQFHAIITVFAWDKTDPVIYHPVEITYLATVDATLLPMTAVADDFIRRGSIIGRAYSIIAHETLDFWAESRYHEIPICKV